MAPRTPDELAALRAIDSPTLSNAIERFKVRPRSIGYAGYELRCVSRARGSMDFIRAPGFSVAALRQRKYGH